MLEDSDYSFLKKINFSIGAGLFAIFTFLFLFIFWVSKNQIDDQNKRTLTEQVELIVNTLDKYSLKDQYDYILKNLIKLDLVEEVALFSGKCKVERLFPMNRDYDKDCINGYSDGHLVYSVVNSYKDTGLSSILIKMKSNEWTIFKSLISYTLPVFITLILLFILIVFYINKRLILTPIESLINSIEEFSTKGDINAPASTAVEIRPIYEAISKKNKEALESQKLLQDKKEKEVIVQAAQQIAHDMKSPISALELILKELSGKNQQYYKIGSMVIEDINSLIEKLVHKKEKKKTQYSEIDIYNSLSEIVEQKRIEYRSFNNIRISIDLPEKKQSRLIKLDKTEFNVVVSNIINNAIQAIGEDAGKVTISLLFEEDYCLIDIRDNGVGIAKKNLSRIMEKGVSIGKNNGRGLGLSDAIVKISSWGGKLEIDSIEGLGSKVSIKIPNFVMNQEVDSYDYVQIEDYPLLRMLWESSAKEQGISLLSISHPSEFELFKNQVPINASIYIDSRFDGDDDLRGEVWAKSLFDNGYKNIYLASGEGSIVVDDYPYIVERVDKKPPWEKSE